MVSQTESLGMVPRTPLDSVRKSTRIGRATPGASTKQTVPSHSTRKANRKQGRASKQAPSPPQPSPEDLARAGGLYFDMEGRPVFVEMKPATFYGASFRTTAERQLSRPSSPSSEALAPLAPNER